MVVFVVFDGYIISLKIVIVNIKITCFSDKIKLTFL
nr:MAG TPA: hypothetical protein [Caudoviricetes sp.]